MTQQKRIAAIHDISGFGKCSLTVVLPILSAAGIETSVVPTAVLSTHTGGLPGFTYRDLTEDIRPFTQHWKSLNLKFDAIYTGFLGSFEQLELVKEVFDTFKTEDTLIMVDPVMADHGKLYSIFSPEFAVGMKLLCEKADIIVPNITEAALLTGEAYCEGPYSQDYIESLIKKLSVLKTKKIVLTGVFFDEDELGAATYDRDSGKIEYALSKRVPGFFHGTGDVFGSALLSALLNGFNLRQAAQIAADFTSGSIQRTFEAKTDVRFGVNFEQEIPSFLRALELMR
jgi:pyridoxine kinase